MKVVCVNDRCTVENSKLSIPIKGNVYHVIEERIVKGLIRNGQRVQDGIYYNLIETGYWYHSSLFIKINDTEMDETELVNECFKIESE